jgi:DNA sulfur modification protein DndE
MLNVKTNKQNQLVVSNLTRKFSFANGAVIARIAIAYSLQKLTKFDTNIKNIDNSGKEYHGHNLFNSDTESLYRTLFNQYYEKITTDDEWSKLVKLHLDDGLSKLDNLIYKQNKNHVDVLIESIKDGLQLLDTKNISTPKKSKNIDTCNREILLDLGMLSNGEKLVTAINNQEKNSNQHIAIAGTTGAGKTEFVKDLLWQIYNQSNGELKFIFFDPKGEGKSDNLKPFLELTKCNFMDVSKGGLKFNPLSHIDLVDENLQRSEIQSFRDAVASINNTGPTQKKNLSTVLHKLFVKAKKNGEHPTVSAIKNELEIFYKEQKLKADSLTAIFDDIADWFYEGGKNIYNENQYINLPSNIPSSASQTIIFLMLNYLSNIFMSCNDTKSNDSIKSMRYVIVVDEAHVYLKNKKAREIIERLLRLIRSKGVMIILMTQGVEDYKQSDFDFTSQIGTSILLDINDKNNNKYIQSFLGVDKGNNELSRCLKNLQSLKGVACIDTPQLIDINLFFKRV